MSKVQAVTLFVRILETGQIAPAAQSLQIPKAMAARLIQRLEVSLGVKRLNRTPRRVSVTSDGAAHDSHANPILEELREVEDALS